MLLYLNTATWAGDGAEALAEQVRVGGGEVEEARRRERRERRGGVDIAQKNLLWACG